MLAPGRAAAEVMLLIGTVVAVDEPQREVVLRLHPADAPPGTPLEALPLMRVRMPPADDGSDAEGPAPCLRVDRTIRVWGRRDAAAANVFWATMVRGSGGPGGGDPTGVRARLGRSCPVPDAAADEDGERLQHGRSGHAWGGGHGGRGGRGGGGGGR